MTKSSILIRKFFQLNQNRSTKGYLFTLFFSSSLKNIGATCYMNSILQCLLNIDPFRYDLMVTNSELITSSLLQDNAIYM